MEYAGFWRRFVAYLIDYLIIGAGAFAVGFLIGILAAVAGADDVKGGWLVAIYVITIAGYYLYYAFMESSANQATIGKIALGLKVTDEEGNRISFGRALGRTVAKILSALTLFIGFIMAGFTDRKQALHDKVAHTLVVKRSAAPAA
jgi:uncharacterized RDD family membrane protein YckC